MRKTMHPRAESPPAIPAPPPAARRLTTRDYWHLQDHRQRCEEAGTEPARLLARQIEARMLEAEVIAPSGVGPDLATGGSWIRFALDGRAAQSAQLFHWDYPARGRGLPVASLLGITLLGMREGQDLPLPPGCTARRVTLLEVLWQPEGHGVPRN